MLTTLRSTAIMILVPALAPNRFDPSVSCP